MWFWFFYFVLGLIAISGLLYWHYTCNSKYYNNKLISIVLGRNGVIPKLVLWIKGGGKSKITAEVVIIENNNFSSCCISFHYDGMDRKLFVPIYKAKKHSHNNKSIHLIKDEKKLSIPHPPGFKFYCDASHLGGESIIVTDLDSGEEKIHSKFEAVDF